MMAQALAYLGLDCPAVRADDAGGFSGPTHDADFIIRPSRLQHPYCAVGVFLPATKGAGVPFTKISKPSCQYVCIFIHKLGPMYVSDF